MLLHLEGTQRLEAWRQDDCIGRLRYKWISPHTIHIVSLVTRHPSAIWILKRQVDALGCWQVMFHRRKLTQSHHPRPWRFYWRRAAHVLV